MKKSKILKILFSALGIVMAIALMAGCGNANESAGTDTAQPAKTGKTLVVYYSAQGHTEAMAKAIAEELKADTFAIKVKNEYTAEDLNYRDENSRCVKEHNDESLQNSVELVSTQVPNWEEYDTVFFGYPIWWHAAAWPVNGFVKANDFSGKKVIPFCVAISSGIADSGEKLAEMAGTGDWQEGMGFISSQSPDDAADWVANLAKK